MRRILMVGSQQGGMEDGVSFPLLRELQPVSKWTKHLQDFKRALSFHGKLLAVCKEMEVLGI